MNLADKKILVTGGRGFLGSHVVQKLIARGVPASSIAAPEFPACDLRKREDVQSVVQGVDCIIHLAALVGGIGYNQKNPASLFYDNIVMGMELLEAAADAHVEKCLCVATVCSYPKFTPVPFRETSLWDGYPEETNASYGLAKRALTIGAEAYRREYGMNIISLIPVNLYGPGDSFDPERAHVIPDLIRKVYNAMAEGEPSVEVWGTGRATREFLYVEDAAEGIVKALELYDKPDPVNLGSGKEISIRDLIALIARLMDFKGEIRWNADKPDGQLRRMLDISKAEQEFGFLAGTDFENGLRKTIAWYEQHQNRE